MWVAALQNPSATWRSETAATDSSNSPAPQRITTRFHLILFPNTTRSGSWLYHKHVRPAWTSSDYRRSRGLWFAPSRRPPPFGPSPRLPAAFRPECPNHRAPADRQCSPQRSKWFLVLSERPPSNLETLPAHSWDRRTCYRLMLMAAVLEDELTQQLRLPWRICGKCDCPRGQVWRLNAGSP